MNLKIGYFDIDYTDADLEYIDQIKKIIILKQDEIMSYFNLKKLNKNVRVVFWNNLLEYRSFFNQKLSKFGTTVPEWETARTTSTENRIDILSLKESKKCQKHNNDDVDNILKVIIHEFVHICTFECNNHKMLPIWFLEGLATNLANQFNEITINCSLEDIKEGKASYVNYYSLVRYLMETYSKDYILSLLTNIEELNDLLVKIYYIILEDLKKGSR